MGRITILILVFMFPILVMGQEQVKTDKQQTEQFIQQQQQQQMEAGKWVQETWKGVEDQTQQQLDEKQIKRCEKKIKYYTKKLEKKPDSAYYKAKLRKYQKRCK